MPFRFGLSNIRNVTRVGQTRSIASTTRLFKAAATAAAGPAESTSVSAHDAKDPISSVPKGQPLKGIVYHKDIPDPIALADEDYPDWLWDLLDESKERAKVENPENRQYHRKANRETIRASNFMKNRKT